MTKTALFAGALLICGFADSTHANPEQDRSAFVEHYRKLFPTLSLQDYADGVYAIDPNARESWRAIEEFPPYEWAIEEGKTLFNTPFGNGAHYADCLPERGVGIAQLYPVWNGESGEVVTLAKALNDCRQRNDEDPLPYQKGEIASLLAYLAYTSRGKTIAIEIPASDPRALAAYEAGKDYYYRRQGQLNFACATCHVQNAGKLLRSELLSPSLGHTSHWPVYRLKWGETGTLHRRFSECLKQIRAESPGAQSEEFRNLEYFLSTMSNGIPINGPSIRK
ncbi:sulfur oxidation c-type cytochrome SoxA [Methylotuvimicrobium alcaliphilum]|uniref:SoxAX cytochrome complex subunit A n=1 Tax=Methylotuvimicrobium alcaliphilum (strain DSM 19304 / NCIMB 14124 / VKM B-2133 / 20Z) TaxID=1091494 RepID=G4SW92_META2|nr:sulfur oxidation c-type cytochrome SoxA [Methylotuvimicrobium alcaliphilum]CCE23007.1 SoxA [Methylotuvimicrobium alcaliphilum 20Z]